MGAMARRAPPCSWASSSDANELRIQAICNEGQHLDLAMDALSQMHSPISDTTYICLLRECIKGKSLDQTRRVREHIGKHRPPQLNGLLGDYLVVAMARCGSAEDAREIAFSLPSRTVYSWSALISSYVDSDRGEDALHMWECMCKDGVCPNHYTFVSLFKACGAIAELGRAEDLHALACKQGFSEDPLVGNTLVSMYGKCEALAEAENVFVSLKRRDVVSWNAMLSVYAEHGEGPEMAFRVYMQMQREGIGPDRWTFAIMLHACASFPCVNPQMLSFKSMLHACASFPCINPQMASFESGEEGVSAAVDLTEHARSVSLHIGQAFHAEARRKGCMSDTLIGNTLIHLIGRCGTAEQAEGMFARLSSRDVVTWNAMLSAYIDRGEAAKALQLYARMHKEGESPDQLTVLLLLQACGVLADAEEAPPSSGKQPTTKEIALRIGRALHDDACRRGFATDVVMINALLTMYGKCGTVTELDDVFGKVPHRDTVTWNAMLSTYARQGLGERALELYRELKSELVAVDDVTLTCAVQACGEAGNLELCMQLHFGVVAASYDKRSSVAATLIHSYGSCASVADAMNTFGELCAPDTVAWNAFIHSHTDGDGSCCRSSLNLFEESKLHCTVPSAESFLILLTSCCRAGLVREGLQVFDSMSVLHGIEPNIKHYGAMADLLGRVGDFQKVDKMLAFLPIPADLTLWLSLLGACWTHANLDLAHRAFRNALHAQAKHPSAYVLMSNICEYVEIRKRLNETVQVAEREARVPT